MSALRSLFLLGSAAALMVASGCGRAGADPDSETNWYRSCDIDGDCKGGLACVCGSCTLECGSASAGACPAGGACVPTTAADSCESAPTGTGRCVEVAREALSNPTGDCAPEGPSTRISDQRPWDERDVWMPDCGLSLTREYYRVYVRPTGTAYMVPHVYVLFGDDRMPCANPQHPLHDVFMRYSDCGASGGDSFFADDMTPADALAIARYLHDGGGVDDLRLRFVLQGDEIVPTPFIEDVVDACQLRTAEDYPEVEVACAKALEILDRGLPPETEPVSGVPYAGQGAQDLVYALNRLYGIDAPRMQVSVDPMRCALPEDAGLCSPSETRWFYDPTSARCVSRPYGDCGREVHDFGSEAECTERCRERAARCASCDENDVCQSSGDCSACPVLAPPRFTDCADEGLTCYYGASDEDRIRCQQRGGRLRWDCGPLTSC